MYADLLRPKQVCRRLARNLSSYPTSTRLQPLTPFINVAKENIFFKYSNTEQQIFFYHSANILVFGALDFSISYFDFVKSGVSDYISESSFLEIPHQGFHVHDGFSKSLIRDGMFATVSQNPHQGQYVRDVRRQIRHVGRYHNSKFK
jgi:hypothetical protein